MFREKTQKELIEEMNNRQKAMQREENLRAERAEREARYNRLSPHEKKYYHEPNELAFRLLVEAYQKDEYSLSKSVEFAYNDYIGDYDDAVTPREKRIGAAWEKIATDYRNAHFFPLVHESFKKRVNRLLSKKELTEKEVHAEILQEYSVSEDEFKQKFSEKFSRAIELAEENFTKDSVTILRDVLHFGIFQRMSFLSTYSKTYKRNWIIKGIIIFLIFGVAPLTILGYDSLRGNNFDEKLANITGKGTYEYKNLTKGFEIDKYVGEVLNSQRHGQGTYIWGNGNEFIGEWQKGNIVKGTYNFANGDVFVGEFYDNEKTSINWRKDQEDVSIKTGNGTRTLENGVYTGDWKDGLQHGQGTFRFENGVYTGDWKDGMRHGQGTLTTENGVIYTGGFKENLLHGEGIVSFEGVDKSVKFNNGEEIK
jgi:hypothetical protein